jgi:hypothetical protein
LQHGFCESTPDAVRRARFGGRDLSFEAEGGLFMKEFCEPKLTPIRDTDDFFLLRCDAGCFHLVLPYMTLHLTVQELRLARVALQTLWSKAVKPELCRGESLLFQAFRCPEGHCHLLCHGSTNLCLNEECALVLQREMQAREEGSEPPSTRVSYLA